MSGFSKTLWYARSCYGHFAGQLALEVIDAMTACAYLVRDDREFRLTDSGIGWMQRWSGTNAAALTQLHGEFCMDRTERRAHIGGPLGRALLDAFIRQGLLARTALPRQVVLTARGQRFLIEAFSLGGKLTKGK